MITANKFKSHGRATFTRDGQILICEAIGPFNKELIQALIEIERSFLEEISADGVWVDITIIKENALSTPDALQVLGQYLKALTEAGFNSCASALVIGDDVVGGHLMTPLLVNVFLKQESI